MPSLVTNDSTFKSFRSSRIFFFTWYSPSLRYVYLTSWFRRYCFLPDPTPERMSHPVQEKVTVL
jgi:hypothetical protein